MTVDEIHRQLQGHFTDGLTVVIGSGLSMAEGLPGMAQLADFYTKSASDLSATLLTQWSRIEALLTDGIGLEAALLKEPPSDELEKWIAQKTAELILPTERQAIESVFDGARTLRLSEFLSSIRIPSNGLPIVTTNYDRLVEVACEFAGLHVDTTAVGIYSGKFDQRQSSMASCRGLVTRSKVTILDHFPRAAVLKPHGSLDWYKVGDTARRCSIDLPLDRLIITPGLNKYRAGYNSPFDAHREIANRYVDRASKILVVGYGFNDDHLQTHLVRRIREGVPTVVMNRSLAPNVLKIATESPSCICISSAGSCKGSRIVGRAVDQVIDDKELWDLGSFTKEILK